MRDANRDSSEAARRRARPPLSIIVPVLNEELSLEELATRLGQVLPRDAEVIFVDDGSSDGTPGVLRELSKRDSRIRVVRFRRNFGKSTALVAGFRRARGDIVATIDGDLQEDPGEILKLADKLAERFDLVCGWRRVRHDPSRKVFGSRVFNRAVSWLSGVKLRDINCGLKVMRREVVEDLVLAGGFHRFIPLLAHAKGFRITEEEVAHRPRKYGSSRYGGDRILEGLLDLAVILFLLRQEGRASRLFVGWGATLGFAGIAVSGYIAYLRLAHGTIASRFPLLALGLVLLVVGVQLFSLGLFGELLAHHFRAVRPFEPALWEAEEDREGSAVTRSSSAEGTKHGDSA